MLASITAKTPPRVAAALRLIEEGRARLERGEDDQAVHHFERSVAVDPQNAYGYYFLARAHQKSRRYDQAIAFAGRAAALAARSDPLCASRAFALQGSVYEHVGRFADARRAYVQALRSDSNNSAARSGLSRLSGQ